MSSSDRPPSTNSTRGSKLDTVESSSSDELQELQTREIRLPQKLLSKAPENHPDSPSDTEGHVQPLRTSSKRRRTFVTSESSDEQEKISVERRLLSPPAEENSNMDGYSPSKKGRRIVHRHEAEKPQLASDEENLADEVDEERMSAWLRTSIRLDILQGCWTPGSALATSNLSFKRTWRG